MEQNNNVVLNATPTPLVTQTVTSSTYENDPYINAIQEQTAAIHLQFAVLIAVMIFLKIWRRGK